jgi:multiple sugar transport system permease protein
VAGRVLRYTGLILLSLSFLLPIIWMLSSSLKYDAQVYTIPPSLIPQPVRWANYPEALAYLPWATYTYNTLIRYALPSVVGVLISCSLVAYGFSRIQWRGRDVFFFICIATMMIPYQVTMIPLFIVYKKLGWVNTYLPLTVIAFFGSPYLIFMFRQFFLGIPSELSDAARIDGCSELGILVRVVVPLAKPAYAVAALFQFLYVWHDYLGPLIYLSKKDLRVVAIGLAFMRDQLFFRAAQGQSYPYLMAMASVFAIPIILLFFLAQRTFIEGVALTGLKG